MYAFSPAGERVAFGGSPQLFQTGESYQQVPYVNVQHPHDMVMGLGATYRVETPKIAYLVGADVVGSPTLDSWAARVGWHRGPWKAQFSGGYFRKPEWFEPYETTRITASVEFDGAVASRPLAATLAWGHHREDNGFNDHADGYLLEWDLRATDRTALYGRVEASANQIFGLGLHPAGFNHAHVYSHIDPLTLGLVRDVGPDRWGRLGIGADFTVYRMSQDLIAFFDGSRSFHVFLRWRPVRTSMAHVH